MAHVVSRGQVTGSRRFGLLPAEATSFVGRTIELAGITTLLGSARMVSVTGPAGVGKTRISVCAASMVAEQYPDGMFFADLAGVGDPAQLSAAVAAALGLPDGDGPRDADVVSHVRDKRLLLILDTCEHLVDACAALADRVLRSAPRVTLLATSRQPLDAPGEHAFPLLPLPAEADAVDLFAQRAAAVVPGFAVTPRNRADIVALCRRLDGLPLAVELAAVRLRALPLAELGRQLESGIRTLTVSRRGTSPRHQTLRAAVDWSYRLCGPAERTLWQRLSVFAETFDVSGAEQVCAGGRDLPRDQVLPALVGLVDKSVVARDAAEPARYRMLGVLREYGADRLAEAEGPELYLDRLASWALALARDFDEQFRNSATAATLPGGGAGGAATGSQEAALRRVKREYPSIVAVLGYALGPLEQPDFTPGPEPADVTERRRLGAELALAMAYYWQTTGMFAEGRQWLGRAASALPDSARERTWLLGVRGRLTTLKGDVDSALPDIHESIRLALAAGPSAELAVARGYLHLTLALTLAGRTAEALAAGETARQRLTDCGHRTGLAGLEVQLGYLHQLSGDCDAAIESSARGLALLGEGGQDAPGNERWLSGWLHLIAGLALAQRPDRTADSAAALRRALASAHEIGDIVGTAHAVETLGWLAARGGQYERTAWLLGAADQLWSRTGRRLSGIAAMEKQHQQAVQSARKSLGERRYTAAYAHGGALDLGAVVRNAADDGTTTPAGGSDAPLGSAAPTRPAIALLTRREREIGELVASGLSNREIATRLFISKRTVDAHVDHIFSKLEISSRVQLTVLLREPGQGRATVASASAG